MYRFLIGTPLKNNREDTPSNAWPPKPDFFGCSRQRLILSVAQLRFVRASCRRTSEGKPASLEKIGPRLAIIFKRGSIAFAVFLFLPFAALAQQLPGNDPLTVDISPSYPRPYQTITITPGSNAIDLSAATVTISVNGTVVAKGSGTTPATATVGGPGETTTVSVTATSGGQSYTKKLSIHPADVALVVEPMSTTHAFYPGGALVAPEGRVRLIAIPDIRTSAAKPIAPQNLVYTWKLGDQVLTDASGIGRSVLSATAPVRYRDALVTVTVTSSDSALVAQAQTVISPIDPVIRVYQNDPLLGPDFAHALGANVTMQDTEDTFRVVPYFFATLPSISWSVNGSPMGSDKDITVRSTGSGTGTAVLNVLARETSGTRSGGATFSVHFGSGKGTGIFGL